MRKKPPAGDRSRIEKPESEKDLQFVELARDPEIRDALSPVTRNERRALLGASFVALAITLGGLIPERISAFDVEISATAQSKLLLLLAGVLAYFILAFLLYGYSDYRAWILAIGAVNRSRKESLVRFAPLRPRSGLPGPKTATVTSEEEILELAEVAHSAEAVEDVLRAARWRIVFEYGVPLLASELALFLVLNRRGGIGWLAPVASWSVLHPMLTVFLGLASTAAILVLMLRTSKRFARWTRRLRDRRRHRATMRRLQRARSLPVEEQRRVLEQILTESEGESRRQEGKNGA